MAIGVRNVSCGVVPESGISGATLQFGIQAAELMANMQEAMRAGPSTMTDRASPYTHRESGLQI